MLTLHAANWHVVITWLISLASIALVLLRPKRWPEAIWAVADACLLTASGLITVRGAAGAVARATDVYLFLTGMMLMSELARREGVFDWIAGYAVHASRGSPSRLFFLIYTVGTVVTVFLSNDATAVVLTPAVLAALRAAKADPFAYLLICAFIANAAAFLLPISNPANLVVYSASMAPLRLWLSIFVLTSIAATAITFMVLRWIAAKHLHGRVRTTVDQAPLSPAGKLTLSATAFLGVVLLLFVIVQALEGAEALHDAAAALKA